MIISLQNIPRLLDRHEVPPVLGDAQLLQQTTLRLEPVNLVSFVAPGPRTPLLNPCIIWTNQSNTKLTNKNSPGALEHLS